MTDGSATNWTMWEAIGVFIGAAGQISTAAILLIFTRRFNRATAMKYLGDQVNDWNRLVVESQKNKTALKGLRAPVVDDHTDTVVFSYLNYLRTGFEMREARIIDKGHEEEMMKNGVAWLLSLPKDAIERYLSRGYDDRFKNRFWKEFQKVSR
jgi:hypothetical protein